jgi:hypothetical protein
MRRVGAVIGAGCGALALLVGVGAAAYGLGRTTSAPAVSAPTALSPADAQAQVCAIIAARHGELDAAVAADNSMKTIDWANPEFIATQDRLVKASSGLADELQSALNRSESTALTSAINDYIAGLRAQSIARQHRGSDKELNGVALIYNQVRRPALEICGIPV